MVVSPNVTYADARFRTCFSTVAQAVRTVTRKKAHRITLQAHSSGVAPVTTTRKAEAEECCSRLQMRGLTSSIEPVSLSKTWTNTVEHKNSSSVIFGSTSLRLRCSHSCYSSKWDTEAQQNENRRLQWRARMISHDDCSFAVYSTAKHYHSYIW